MRAGFASRGVHERGTLTSPGQGVGMTGMTFELANGPWRADLPIVPR